MFWKKKKEPKNKDRRETLIKFLRYFSAVNWEQSQVVYGGNKRLCEEANVCILAMFFMAARPAEMA